MGNASQAGDLAQGDCRNPFFGNDFRGGTDQSAAQDRLSVGRTVPAKASQSSTARSSSTCRGSVALTEGGLGQAHLMPRRPAAVPAPRYSFVGFRFPPAVIMLAVRWYLRYGMSTVMWKSFWLSVASLWITSRSTGGCSGSPRS